MRKILILTLAIFIISGLAACNTSQSSNTISSPEVVVKMPTDDTVNGYRTDSTVSSTSSPNTISGDKVAVGIQNENNSSQYCANKNSKIFHKSNCGSVSSMKETNKYYAARETLIKEGYSPCSRCQP